MKRMPRIDTTQQTEPDRKSILDILRRNLNYADKQTFVHRLIYVGEHAFHETGKHGIGRCMEKTIMKVNSDYNDEPLTGVLLIYPKHFCHFLEGSEDSLHKHFQIITTIKQYARRLGRMKLLMIYHHVNRRFLNGWLAVAGKAPKLLVKLNTKGKKATTKLVYQCIVKIYKLALVCRPNLKRGTIGLRPGGPKKPRRLEDEGGRRRKSKRRGKGGKVGPAGKDAIAELSEKPSTSPERFATGTRGLRGKARERFDYILRKNQDCLPSYGLLDFLLRSHRVRKLRDYIATFAALRPLDSYKDKIWPVPTEFVPYNVFDKPIDFITDLPIEKIEDAPDMFENLL